MNQQSMGPANASRKIRLSEIKKRLKAKNPRPKIIVRAINLQMHAYPTGIKRLLSKLLQDRETINLLRFADHVIFQSNYQYSFFKKAGFSGSAYSIVHNGADIKYLNDSPRPTLDKCPIRIVSSSAAGRNTKRHDILAKISLLPGVEVIHAGVWPEKLPPGKVILKGMLDKIALSELYRTAHYFIHPAIKDPCPNAIFEAICSGLPVLYNPDSGSSAEIVQQCGLLIDETCLEQVLINARENYLQKISLVKEKKPYYTIKRAAKEYMEIFNSVMKVQYA
jgi:glycosyltransferase involved in cell wall biosynthesis